MKNPLLLVKRASAMFSIIQYPVIKSVNANILVSCVLKISYKIFLIDKARMI